MDGGILMVFLVPCAFLALAYMIQGAINLRKNRIIPKMFFKKLKNITNTEEAKALMDEISKDDSTFARIFSEWSKKRLSLATKESGEALKDVIDNEISRLYHQNNQLLAIYQVAPLLGLLGTVLGMMKTFYDFSIVKEHSIEVLSIGINEALITTLWGLSIAIPSYLALHLIKQKLFRYEASLLPETIKTFTESLDTALKGEAQNRASEDK